MTSSLLETGEGWGEREVQRLHSFSLEGLLWDNYKLYESTQQKVEETHQKNGELGEENYFSPLPLLDAPL